MVQLWALEAGVKVGLGVREGSRGESRGERLLGEMERGVPDRYRCKCSCVHALCDTIACQDALPHGTHYTLLYTPQARG